MAPGPSSGGQAAHRARPEDPAHAQRAQRPHVGPVRDGVRRELVVDAVTRQKRDLVVTDGAHRDRRARLPVGGVEVDASRIRTEERVEAAAADDSEHQSIVSSARSPCLRPA